MACVDRVAKNGTNETQHYRYAMAADIYDAVRGELAKRFILAVPRLEAVEFAELQTRSGGTLRLCTVRGHLDFTDAETGEVVSVQMTGQGSDSIDKAYYKAITGATKSALVQTFLIPTGDDPEHEPKPSKAPPPAGMEAVRQRMKAAAPQSVAAAVSRHADEPPPPSDDDAPPGMRGDAAVLGTPPPNGERSFRFGAAKGKPLNSLDVGDLRFYEGALRRDLASDDPTKQRYADVNRAALDDVQTWLRYRGHAANL